MVNVEQVINHMWWNSRGVVGMPNSTEIHRGWVNHINSGGNWAEIRCGITELSDRFEMMDSPYQFEAPKKAIGYFQMYVNNRFDVFKKTEITAPAFSETIRCLGVEDVSGELFSINDNGKFDAVIYPKAYNSDFVGDLVLYTEHGSAPRLKKLIKFDTAPLNDVSTEFEIEFSERSELSPRTLKQGEIRVEERDRWSTKLGNGDYLYLNSNTQKNDGLYVRAWDEPQKRGIGMKKPLIWDSNPIYPKIQEIETYIKWVSGNKYKLVKIIPKSFFAGSVFPVYTDTTSTFYPDPHPETNSVDGYVLLNQAATFPLSQGAWDSFRDAAAGSGFNDSFTTGRIGFVETTDQLNFILYRFFTLFDISIPVADTIISAMYSLNISSKKNDENDGYDYASILGTTPASNTALANADFDQFVNNFNDLIELHDVGQRKDISSISTGVYTDWALNSIGIGTIPKVGIAKFGALEGHDVEDIVPGINGSNIGNRLNPYTAEDNTGGGGVDRDPKLTLEHLEIDIIPKAMDYYRRFRS